MSEQIIKPIKRGDFVKIRLQSPMKEHPGRFNMERVWAEVLERFEDSQELRIRIDNTPVVTGFKRNEEVRVPVSFVFDHLDGKEIEK